MRFSVKQIVSFRFNKAIKRRFSAINTVVGTSLLQENQAMKLMTSLISKTSRFN